MTEKKYQIGQETKIIIIILFERENKVEQLWLLLSLPTA